MSPTIGDILAVKLSARITLMAEEDERAVRIATELKGRIAALGKQLELEVLNFGIKKPSRSGMIKVIVEEGTGENLHPRSPEFHRFIQIVRPYGLWLAWVSVKALPEKSKHRRIKNAGKSADAHRKPHPANNQNCHP